MALAAAAFYVLGFTITASYFYLDGLEIARGWRRGEPLRVGDHIERGVNAAFFGVMWPIAGLFAAAHLARQAHRGK